MSVYSVDLFTGPLPAGFTNLYTVAAGTTVVIRDIELYNGSGGTVTTSIAVSVSGKSAYVISTASLANQTVLQWQGRCVLPAGSVIQGFTSGSSNCTAKVSGYDLGS